MLPRLLVPVGIILASACGSAEEIVTRDPPIPPASTVVVVVRTTGSPVDPDGYELAGHTIQPNDSITLTGLYQDRLVLELVGVASTCRVNSPNPQEVFLGPGSAVRIYFSVQCARTGAILITANLDGSDESPFAFAVLVEGRARGVLRAGQTVLAADLLPGINRVLLARRAGLCDLAGPSFRDVEVTSDDTLALSVGVNCPASSDTDYVFLIERGGTIELLTESGSRSLTLTPPGVMDQAPIWSPDGSRIAFFSDRGGTPGLYIMQSNGMDVVRLADAAGPQFPSFGFPFPAPPLSWSPDGRVITITSVSSASVRWIQADGSGERSTSLGRSTSWSPDGRRFVAELNGDIVIVDSETGAIQPVTNDGSGERHRDRAPRWSPRGDHIVWLSDQGVVDGGPCGGFCTSGGDRLWISDGEGRSPRLARPGLVGWLFPIPLVWSPRGSLLGLSYLGGFASVYDPTDGTLTATPFPQIGYGAWSPDERQVVYPRYVPNEGYEVVRDLLAGGAPRTLLSSREAVGVTWRPRTP